jgi:hypothetical protein
MENKTLKELILNLEKELRRLGYSEGSMTFYKINMSPWQGGHCREYLSMFTLMY